MALPYYPNLYHSRVDKYSQKPNLNDQNVKSVVIEKTFRYDDLYEL